MTTAARCVAGALAAALTAGCSSRGVDTLASKLLWATNWMKITRQTERRVEYVHEQPGKYWIIALPANSRLFQLGNTGIPSTVIAIVEDCARDGKPILALIEEQSAQCAYPAYPEPLNPVLVAKESGQTTTVTLVRSDQGVRIAKRE